MGYNAYGSNNSAFSLKNILRNNKQIYHFCYSLPNRYLDIFRLIASPEKPTGKRE